MIFLVGTNFILLAFHLPCMNKNEIISGPNMSDIGNLCHMQRSIQIFSYIQIRSKYKTFSTNSSFLKLK